MADYDFTDQVALITGGGRGLGLAFAQALAQAGATVVIVARSESQLQNAAASIEQAGSRALAFAADVTDRVALERVVAEVERQLGYIDILVNSAGVLRAFGPVAEVDPDDWWREIEVNVRGTFLATRAVLPGMLARRQGRIINMASVAGLQALPAGSAYCLSKAAVIRFTESLALDHSEQGIQAFAIHPGNVRTAMLNYVAESDEVKQRAPIIQRWVQEMYQAGNDTPIDRSVELMLFLTSGKADALSGRYLDVDVDLDVVLQQIETIQRDDWYTLRLRTA
ncbi:MAG TPA: SDR family oxidoreductase [Anaerolineae bacterium]|nr:SDR family oxidoreductase [Anaerolineae bacterium]